MADLRRCFWLLTPACSAALACEAHVGVTEVPGEYVAEYLFATETLVVSADHTFQQKVAFKNGTTASANGRWRFDSEQSDIYFSESFLVVINGFGKEDPHFNDPGERVTSILPVRSSAGRLQIGLDPAIPYFKRRH